VRTSYTSDRVVVTLTINNAARANCLSTPVLEALLSALTAINPRITLDSSADTEDPIAFAYRVCKSHAGKPIPKIVILKSVGKIFCSGHDLRELYANNDNQEAIHDIFRLCNKVMLTIRRLPQIVIAQVSHQGTVDVRCKESPQRQEHN
jgi:enoyl-CoA hydratase/carnithine racemase